MHNNYPVIHSTTVLGVVHNGEIAIGADGQATMGDTVAKSNVKKLRQMDNGNILAGFAGATSDAFAILEKLDEKLNMYRSNLQRSAVELAKEWRTDRYLRRLEAMLIVMDKDDAFIISGSGDVLAPDEQVLAIGSGANYARSAALALKRHASHLSAKEIVREALQIAADICIYTNSNFTIMELPSSSNE